MYNIFSTLIFKLVPTSASIFYILFFTAWCRLLFKGWNKYPSVHHENSEFEPNYPDSFLSHPTQDVRFNCEMKQQ